MLLIFSQPLCWDLRIPFFRMLSQSWEIKCIWSDSICRSFNRFRCLRTRSWPWNLLQLNSLFFIVSFGPSKAVVVRSRSICCFVSNVKDIWSTVMLFLAYSRWCFTWVHDYLMFKVCCMRSRSSNFCICS